MKCCKCGCAVSADIHSVHRLRNGLLYCTSCVVAMADLLLSLDAALRYLHAGVQTVAEAVEAAQANTEQ
jgi:hypothetical protein